MNVMRLSLFIKKGIFVSLLFVALTSCEKRVTPNKVDRIIQKGSWRMSSFVFQGASIQLDYLNNVFSFEDDGVVYITSNLAPVTGKWSVSIDKKPTHLYFYEFLTAPHDKLEDDWVVNTISNTDFTMESDNGSYVNTITFTKI